MNSRDAIPVSDTVPSEHAVRDALTPAALLSACVMLVDDDPLMTDIVQGHLEDAGYRNFVVTNDPRQALDLMRQHQPGVLLLDLMMPGLSGYDVLTQVRADKDLRFTPVIVLTAASGSDAKLRSLQLGATDILAKPVDESELLLRVRNTLAFQQYHEHTVNHDEVTGLPSRKRFDKLVADQIASGCALFVASVPALSQVRETMGQDAGDMLARELVDRLQAVLRSQAATRPHLEAALRTAVLARLRGDEFGLMLPGLADAESAEALAKALETALCTPFNLQRQEIVPTPRIGIALSATDGGNAGALIKAAEQARSEARESAQPHVFFSRELNWRSHERLTMATTLRHAVQRGELLLHYQPKVNMHTGQIASVEALVRWQHPMQGLLLPDRFLPLAEELDLGAVITRWVADRACADAVGWIRQGLDLRQVAINISPSHWRTGALPEALVEALRKNGLPASRLAVELTEGMLHADLDASLRQMQQIAKIGVAIAIDDFGSGQTSLRTIKRVPAQELKLDRSLVAELPGTKQDTAVARTIVTLGHSLGMTVVAEGVESAEQLLELTTLECDQFQGNLYSPPVSAAELAELVRSAD